MFLIRDGSGYVFNEVENPAVVFDSSCSVLLKIGEHEQMEKYYSFVYRRLTSAGIDDMANDLVLMSLPRDQGEIDKVFQICDYVGKIYEEATREDTT